LNDKITSIKKVLKIASQFLLILWIILIGLWTFLQLESVQTYLAQKAASFLSEELHTEISIEKLRLKLLKTVELESLIVEDQRGDTLAAIGSLQFKLLSLSLEEEQVALDLALDRSVVKLIRYKEDSVFNHQFVIDYFKSDQESEPSSFLFSSELIEVSNSRFSLHDHHKQDSTDRINYAHMDLSHINLLAKDFELKGAYINTKLKDLTLRTEDEFVLDCFSADVSIEPELLSLQSLKVQTFGTELYADISLTANSFKSYKNFEEEVHISANFKNALIELSDIAYFVPQMTTISNQVLLDGKFKGTVSNLSSEEFELHLNKNTFLAGEFDIRGLPKIDETFIFFNADQVHSNAKGIENLPFDSFKENFKIKSPKGIDQLGNIDFKGNFAGFISDFVAYGTFQTALGSFSSDISLSQENSSGTYQGSLSTKNFDLGSLLENRNLGKIAFNVELDGQGFTVDAIEAKASGEVNYLDFKEYRYNNISLNGEFSSKKFIGKLEVKDENLKLNFEGKINADTTVLASDFKLRVDEAKLAQLNLFNQKDSLTNLTFKADFNLLGSQLEEMDGKVYFDSLHYVDNDLDYKTDSVFLEAKALEKGRDVYFTSSFMDASIYGQFRLIQLGHLIKQDILRQIPNEVVEIKEIDPQDFEYEVLIKNFKPITDIFIPDLRVDSSTFINGTFNNEINVNTLQVKSPRISYKKFRLKNMILTAGSNPDGVSLAVNSRMFSFSNSIGLSDYHLSASLEKGLGKVNTSWEGINDSYENGQFQIEAQVDSFDVMSFEFKDSFFYLNDSLWKVQGNNKAKFRNKEVSIDSIALASKAQGILLDGRISRNPNDSMKLLLNNFDLAYINSFIQEEDLKLEGRVKGRAALRDAFGDRIIISDIEAEHLKVNDLNIGVASFESYWLKDSTGIVVNSYIGPRKNPLLKLNGTLQPKATLNKLDFDVHLNQLPIELGESFIDHILSDLEGHLDGKISVKGSAKEPVLMGDINLVDARFKVNYLNTYYKISHKVMIRPDYIGFDLMQIVDEKGSPAIATGTVFHENYQNFNIDIGMEMKNFIGMNTSKKDNELFYGKGIVSGWSNISGFADQLIFEMNLTAKEGTDMKIPIKDDVNVSTNEFLVFTNSPKFKEDSSIQIDLSGISLDFELNVEPEAKTTIIFDESIGDVITAKGKGTIKMEINTLGNFNMFGQYELTEGEYLFTLQNIVNKKFKLSAGSKMMWDGDPYEARLDIQAIYNLRASLYSLMPEDSTGRYRRRVPVELYLNLGGYLLNPDIQFDIKIPSADELVQSRLESVLYVNQNNVNEQELNQQVFGLLLLGRFMPPSTGASNNTASRGAPGMNNGYELLSNQLSNWLSAMSNEFDVGVSYRPADDYAEEELDVSLTTELLDDRLILDGTFGYVSDREINSDGNASNFIGEFMVEYKLKRDGKLRVRGFNRSNDYDPLQINSLYTQGVGLFYQEEYDSFSEVWRKYFKKSKSKEDPVN